MSRLREPSLVSTISSTCFFPYCSFSNRYIQLVRSSWKFSSLVTTRRARSLADLWLLGTDCVRAGVPKKRTLRGRRTELGISLITKDDGTAPHILNRLGISSFLR